MISPLSLDSLEPGEELGSPGDVIRDLTGITYTASTVSRWIHEGHRGVRLEVAMIGGKPKTAPSAARRFVEACTAQAAGPASVSD